MLLATDNKNGGIVPNRRINFVLSLGGADPNTPFIPLILRLATGPPATALTRLDFHQLGRNIKFHDILNHSSLSKLRLARNSG